MAAGRRRHLNISQLEQSGSLSLVCERGNNLAYLISEGADNAVSTPVSHESCACSGAAVRTLRAPLMELRIPFPNTLTNYVLKRIGYGEIVPT